MAPNKTLSSFEEFARRTDPPQQLTGFARLAAQKRSRGESLMDDLTAASPPKKKTKFPSSHDPEWTPREAPLDLLSECPWELPTKKNRISRFDAGQIVRDALETNVIMHPRLPELFTSFLAFKREHGSKLEKSLYAGMNTHDLVARLIKKRPLHFVNAQDYTVLRDGTALHRADAEWRRVGRDGLDEKNPHIHLKDYMSYDEMMLSSLLGTSGPTYFINTGSRRNAGKLDKSKPHETGGIIVGLVGARFHAEGQMDHVICGCELKKNDPYAQDPRLTRIFRDFFYPDHKAAGIRPYKRILNGEDYPFDKDIYAGRIRISIEMALLEADDRAAHDNVKVHLFLAGLGLGVWRVLDEQLKWYFEEVAACIARLDLRHINVLELGWDECPADVKEKLIAVGKKHGIKVIVSSKRDPCAKLDSGDLLVRVWAWDSNSLPGNEYWSGAEAPGCLTSSDDPAAVGCSTIAELHNPYVNKFEHRVKVLQERYRDDSVAPMSREEMLREMREVRKTATPSKNAAIKRKSPGSGKSVRFPGLL